MANYTAPSVQIQQEFLQTPTLADTPLAALIIGPQYNVFDYYNDQASCTIVNSSSGSNAYAGTQTTYALQGVEDANLIDTTSYKLFLDNTVAEYYAPAAPASATVVSTDTTGKTIKVGGVAFQAGFRKLANNLGPSNDALSRDVQVGDIVFIGGATGYTMSTAVTGITYSVTGYNAPATGTIHKGPLNAAETTDIKLTIGGTYTGANDITYQVLCVADNGAGVPTQIKVLSDNVDSSGPFTFSDPLTFNIGTLGLTGTIAHDITGPKMEVGDYFSVAVTAATPLMYDTLQLATAPLGSSLTLNGLATTLQDAQPVQYTDITNASANWSVSGSTVTINASIAVPTTNPAVGSLYVTSPSITDVTAGATLALKVASANAYMARREWAATNVGVINSIQDPSTVAEVLGEISPLNPLAQGVYSACLNANGVPVYYTALGVNDGTSAGLVTAYNAALALTTRSTDYYSIVPLTFDTAVQAAVQAHVNLMSKSPTATGTPTRVTKWRIAWFSVPVTETSTIVGLVSDGTPWKAQVTTTGYTGYTGYTSTLVTVQTPDVGVPNMITAGAKAGDIFNYNFRYDVNKNVVCDSATILSVPTQSTIVVNNPALAPSLATFKFTITRNLASGVKAANYAATASAFNDHRVRVVFPDVYQSGTTTLDGYYLAAALAGQRSGVAPHQPLTNFTVLGPTAISRTLTEFTDADLDTMAAGGVWIVDQTVAGAPCFTRHQLTTGQISGDIDLAEDSITTNTDSISYGLQGALAPFIGIYNINAGAILKVRGAIDTELTGRMSNTYTETAGNQLISYEILSINQDPTFKDMVRSTVSVTEPYPMNHIVLTLQV